MNGPVFKRSSSANHFFVFVTRSLGNESSLNCNSVPFSLRPFLRSPIMFESLCQSGDE